MAPSNNRLLYIKPIATGIPVPGEHYKFDEHAYDLELPDKGIIVKLTYSSIDPYYRGRFRPLEVKSYVGAYVPGTPMTGMSTGKVYQSDSPEFAVGDTVVLQDQAISEYVAIPADKLATAVKKAPPLGIPDYVLLGTLGVTGFTAYVAVHTLGNIKKDDVVFISGAAGAVGLIACQLALLAGATVIGSSSSDKKLDVLRKAGVKHTINYNTDDMDAKLKEYAPNGINLFIDQVGGDTFDTALANMATFGRVIAVGAISVYNTGGVHTYKNLSALITKSLSIRGFTLFHHIKEYPEYLKFIVPLYKEGKITEEYDIREGLKSGETAFQDLFASKNHGKLLIKY